MNIDLQKIFLYLSHIAIFFPLVLSLSNVKHYTKEYRILTMHLVMVILFSMPGMVMALFKINNLPLLHIYTICEFSLLAWFYKVVLDKFISYKLLLALVLLFTSFALYQAVITGWYKFNTVVRSTECLFIIAFCLLCYYKILTELNIPLLQRSPLFWINTGFMFYFSGSLFLFLLNEYFRTADLGFYINVWVFHAVLAVMLYLFIFKGLWHNRKT